MTTLTAWALAHGARLDDNVEIYQDERFGTSLRVKNSSAGLQPHTKVVSCPFELSLSHLNAFDTFKELRSHDEYQFPASFLTSTQPRVIGNFFLARQFTLGEKSFWYPYISSLPQPDEPEKLATPLYYSAEDREWLRGTLLETVVENRERDWRNEYAAGVQLLDCPDITWDIYKWASSIFSSRSFISSLLPPAIFGEKIKESEITIDVSSQPVLFPLVDIANHSNEARVTWFQNVQHAPRDLSIAVDTSIPAGAQIFNNYAPKGNTELLLGYGFILPDNDEVTLAFRRPPDELMALREQQSTYQKEDFSFAIRSRPYTRPETCLPEFRAFSTGCVDLLSLLVMNPEEKLFLEQHPDISLEVDSTGPLVRNAAHVISVLVERLRMMLMEALHVNLGTPLNDNQRTAEAYRNGQIKVLQTTLASLESRLAELLKTNFLTIDQAYDWLKATNPELYTRITSKLAEQLEVAQPIDWNELIEAGWDGAVWILWIYAAHHIDHPEIKKRAKLYTDLTNFYGAPDEYETIQTVVEGLEPADEDDSLLSLSSFLANDFTVPFPGSETMSKQKVLFLPTA